MHVFAVLENYTTTALMSDKPVPREAYRIAEAADALGLCERTIRSRVADGTLASRKVGGARLIPAEALDRALGRPAAVAA